MDLVALLIFEQINQQRPSDMTPRSKSDNIWSVLCETYNLPKHSRLFSWSEDDTFKKLARGIGQDLLNTVETGEHTIIRSEVWDQYTIHLLLLNQYGFVVFMRGLDTASPVHIVFQKCLDASKEDVIDPDRLSRLLEQINTALRDYRSQLEPVDKNKKEIENVRQIMCQNVEKIIERQESLEALMERTEALSANARQFRKHSRKLNRCCYFL